ncbi:MAG TPA: prepilin-type N-terminal cleavage/methylation domain-containing protein [Patescibacteria group bacterium]|nr:prepilin-type N-terminal cleavage/methylation domain-containing protein [Patescibacteria group bacterium]
MKSIFSTKKGFTLIELLVVIAIIGLLSTLAVVALNSARQKARDAKRVADIKQVQTALELFYNDVEAYPTGTTLALGGLTDCTTACDTLSSTGEIAAAASGTTYMGLIPADPSATTAECASGSTGVCHYSYSGLPAAGPETTYEIWLYLEGAVGGLSAGVNCATEAGITSAACTH